MSQYPEISIEESFLIGLCRLRFTEAQKEQLARSAQRISDWRYFGTLANNHGVAALVYDNLETTGLLSQVPQESAAFLRNAALMSLARNTSNMQMMHDVLEILGHAGIKTVLLKGMALELMVYGNRGLRQMSDADVLVERGRIIEANRSLIRAGFKPLPVKSVFHKPILAYLGKHLPSLIKNGFSVELHHELFSRENHELTIKLFDTSDETDFSGKKAWLPRPGILFLYLVKHLYSHEINNDSQLRLYTDLVVLLERYGEEILDDKLTGMAEAAGLTRYLATRLWLLQQFWGQEFPGWVKEYIEKWKEADQLQKFLFFLESPKGNTVPDRSVPYREVFRYVPGLHRKALYLLGDLFPTISFMKNRYKCTSGWKAALYYPHRWGKVLWLMKGIVGDRSSRL